MFKPTYSQEGMKLAGVFLDMANHPPMVYFMWPLSYGLLLFFNAPLIAEHMLRPVGQPVSGRMPTVCG